MQQLARTSQTRVNDVGLARILNDPYAKGNHAKASEVIDILEHAEQGIIEPIKPSQVLQGAVNREGVTCYLDSLLFTMFATIDSYEAMLLQNFDDEPRKRLAMLLRLWVNLFRTGKLITTDIVWLFPADYTYSTDTNCVIDAANTISSSFLRLERRSRVTSTRSIRSLFVYHGETSHANANTTNESLPWW